MMHTAKYFVQLIEQDRIMMGSSVKSGASFKWSATDAQIRAVNIYNLLRLLISTINVPGMSNVVTLPDSELHQHFHIFAKRLGLRGRYYQKRYGRCPAITFAGQILGCKDGQWSMVQPPSRNVRSVRKECVHLACELGLEHSSYELITAAKAFLELTWSPKTS